MFRIFLYLVIAVFFSSCKNFSSVEQDQVIARVGSNYLYLSEITPLIPQALSPSDSIVFVQNKINKWAKQQLLFSQAQINLDQASQLALGNLVKNYEYDLWTRTYKEYMVKSMIDTVIDKKSLIQYYQKNQQNFKLKEPILQMRFLALPKDNIDLTIIKEKFIQNTTEDKAFLDSLGFQFSVYDNRDSIWYNKHSLKSKLPIISSTDFEKYLKKSQFFFFEDAIEVYLLYVSDVRFPDDNTPFSMVKKTIEKIIFNRRKLTFIKQFDQEILNDAIQANKFEIYSK